MEEEMEEAALEPEGEQDPTPESEPDELAKVQKAYESQKVRAEKAEKAAKALEAKLASNKPMENDTPKNEKSNEPDYAKLAFLEGKGVTHPDDQKVIQDEANRLKLPLTDILGMEHIKAKLKVAKNQREAEEAMPDGSGKTGIASKNSVDYWVNKTNKDGTFQTPDDQELAEKVIEARLKQHENKNKFSDILFTG